MTARVLGALAAWFGVALLAGASGFPATLRPPFPQAGLALRRGPGGWATYAGWNLVGQLRRRVREAKKAFPAMPAPPGV